MQYKHVAISGLLEPALAWIVTRTLFIFHNAVVPTATSWRGAFVNLWPKHARGHAPATCMSINDSRGFTIVLVLLVCLAL